MMQLNSPSQKFRGWFVAGGLLAVILLLWLPIDIHRLTGLHEEWVGYSPSAVDDPLELARTTPTRPFLMFPYWLAQLLSSESLSGVAFLHIAIFWIKGVSVYAIIRALRPQYPAIAWIGAILALIYPADDNLMSYRGIGIHLAFTLMLLATALLLSKPRISNGIWITIGILQFFSLGTYEVVYPLMFAAPGLLWGIKTSRGRLGKAIRWYIVPSLMSIRLAYLLLTDRAGNYVSDRLNNQTATSASLGERLNSLVKMGREHLTCWPDILSQGDWSKSEILVAAFTGLLVGAIALYLNRPLPSPHRISRSVLGWSSLFVIGILAMLLGFVLYLPTAYRNETWRVFYGTTTGAGIATAVIFGFIGQGGRLGHIIMPILGGILVMLATLNILSQQQFLLEASDSVNQALGVIIETVPKAHDDAVIVVFDEANLYQDRWRLAGNTVVLRDALSFFYNHPTDARICRISQQFTEGVCFFEEAGVRTIDFDGGNEIVPYDHLIGFHTTSDGQVEFLAQWPAEYGKAIPAESYNPLALFEPDAPPPPRTQTALPCFPVNECIPNSPIPAAQSHIRLEFDNPPPGLFWGYPQQGVSWTLEPQATLNLRLTTDQDLTIRFRITYFLAQDVVDSLRLFVNGVEIPLERIQEEIGPYQFSGVIPLSTLALSPANARLLFTTARVVSPKDVGLGDDTQTLGVLFDWIEISPVGLP